MADAGLSHIKSAIAGRKFPQQNYSFTTKDGLQLTYSVAGAGPLVIAQTPGWGIGKGYLEKGFAPLTEKYTLLCLVSRGTIPSGRPADESKMNTADMGDDIEALRTYIGEEKLTLLGHSNGAAIVLAYASKYPLHAEKLVLISCQLIGFNDMETFQKLAAVRSQDPRYAASLAAFPKAYAVSTDDEMRDTLVEITPYYFAHPGKYATAWQDMIKTGVVQVWPLKTQHQADTSHFPDGTGQNTPDLEKVIAKTILFAGDVDAVCTVKAAEKINEGIPRAKLVVYNDCGHMPWEENRDQFFADLFAFLAA